MNIASPHVDVSYLSESVSDFSSKIEEESKSSKNNNMSLEMGSITGRTIISEAKETESKTDRNLITARNNQNKVQAIEKVLPE